MYRDTHPVKKNCTRTAKIAPWLPRTGTVIQLKYQDPARMLRQPTLTYFIAGPLAAMGNQSKD